jgi:uncharacterized membrane protein YqgA involved in biofilm formation
MYGLGTIANITTIIIGSITGILIGRRLKERYIEILFQALGLATLGIGISMVLESQNILITVMSIIFGALAGEAINIERYLERSANFIKRSLKFRSERFTEGFVTATLLYCIGSMAILGSFEDGLGLFPRLVYTKSMMDGISSIAFSATMGLGVAFSVLPVLVYQGLLTLFASSLNGIMSPAMIAEMTAVGGLMLIGIGINLLKIKEISVTNMLPAIVIAPLLAYFFI